MLTLSGPEPKLCICNYFKMDLTPYFSHAIIRILTKNGKVSAVEFDGDDVECREREVPLVADWLLLGLSSKE